MSRPSYVTRPRVGASQPASAFSVVVLPAPFAPISVTSSRSRTSSAMLLTALMPPYRTSRSPTLSKRAPEIRFDYCEIALHFRRRAFGDPAPVIENSHTIADPHHELHIV